MKNRCRLIDNVHSTITKTVTDYCEANHKDLMEYMICPVFETEILTFLATGEISANEYYEGKDIFVYGIKKTNDTNDVICYVNLRFDELQECAGKNNFDYVKEMFDYALNEIDDTLDNAEELKTSFDMAYNRDLN